MMPSISQGQPAKCTQTIALVLAVSTAAIDSGVILPVASSTSAKTGVAPALTTDEILAIKVRGVTITSSPAPISNACKATSNANVPLPIAMAYLLSAHLANSASN